MNKIRRAIATRCVRLYPFYTGCGSIANSRFIRLLAGNGHGMAWGTLSNGMSIHASMDDFNGRAAMLAGDVDRKLTWICSRIVRPGDTVIDVGSNIGVVTLNLAKLVGPNGTVYSFDPNPTLIEGLRQSIAQNKLTHVHLQQCAIGDEDAELTLRIPLGHSGRGSLIRQARGREMQEVTVSVRRLADVLPPDIGPIRMMKIDVEGYEPQVLRGAQQIFERTPPDAVVFELNDLTGLPADHPSIAFLLQHGYEFFSIPKKLLRVKLLRFDPTRDKLLGHDLLACKTGALQLECG